MGSHVAPTGTVTESEVVAAAVTTARDAPKKTILFDGFVLKLVPVIVTVAPMGPEAGEKEVMLGACAYPLRCKLIMKERENIIFILFRLCQIGKLHKLKFMNYRLLSS